MRADSLERPIRVDSALRAAASALSAVPDSSPRLEAELLMTQATGWSRSSLLAWPERQIADAAADRFLALLDRRLAGEPIAHIRGQQAFWTLDLHVSPDTLIPRPETELLVETTLELLSDRSGLTVADLGTGSGAIAAALAHERPDWRILATDRSGSALAVACVNFQAYRLDSIAPILADWADALAADSLDAIVSNPPYIAGSDPHLARGDLRFEPRSALTPGGDGLDAVRAIARDSARCLRRGGLLLVEHGFDQGPAAREIFAAAGLIEIETRRDLAGHERATLGYRPPADATGA